MSYNVFPIYNRSFGVTYDMYAQSKLNHFDNQFFDEKGNLTVHGKNERRGIGYTLEQKVDYMLDENVLNLDMDLIVWFQRDLDEPVNLSRHLYECFLLKYWNKEINQQTIDLHKLKLRSFFNSKKYYLIGLFKALRQHELVEQDITDVENTGGKTTTTLYRGANSTVPENKVNVDVATTSLDYADDFTKTKQDVTENAEGGSTTTNTKIKDKDLQFWFDLPRDLDLEWLWKHVDREELFR